MKSTTSVLECRRPHLPGLIAVLLASLTLAPFAGRPRAQAFVAVFKTAEDDNTVRPSDSTVTEYPIPTANSGSSNITVGPDGNFWFTETNANKLGLITAGGFFKEFPLPNPNSQPFGIVLGPDLSIWFTEQGANKIGRMIADGTITEFAIPTANSQPFGIARGGDAALWFVENNTNKIGRIATSGAITEYAIPTPGSGPLFITPGPDGNLWFTERTAGKIGRISPAGVITEFAIPTSGSGPEGITSAFDGNIWFTEKHVDKIGIATTSGNITELQLFAGSDPARITAATDGSIYVTEQAPNKFLQITPSGLLSSITPAGFSFRDFLAGPPGGALAGIGFGEDKAEGGGLSTGYTVALETQLNAVSVARSEFTGEVELTKTGSPDPVDGGHPITYTIIVKNKTTQPLSYTLVDVEDDTPELLHLPPNIAVTNPGWRSLPPFQGLDISGEHLDAGEVRQYTIHFDTEPGGGTARNRVDLIPSTGGRIMATATSKINATPDPDFLLPEPDPVSQIIGAAQKAGFTIKTQPSPNHQAPPTSVNFSASVSPPTNSITTNFSPGSVGVPGSTMLNVNTTPDTPFGSYTIMIKGTAGSVTRTSGVTVVLSPDATPDFSISFDHPTITATQGPDGIKVPIDVHINRTGGFTGNVTVTPPRKAAGIKPKNHEPMPTTDASVKIVFKVAAGVPPGQYPLNFTATDDFGRTRSGSVTIIVQ